MARRDLVATSPLCSAPCRNYQLELESLPKEGSSEQMESRESLAMILESGNQARDVVRKVLMFARKAKPELAPVDFPAAVSRGCSLPALLPSEC
jgi:hypothetical protein